MPIKRFFKILQANLNQGKEGYTYIPPEEPPKEKSFYEPKTVSNENPVDVKEAGYYSNLELPYGAGFDEIRKNYRRLMKQYHPDKFHNDSGRKAYAEEVSRLLIEAYTYFEDKFSKKT
ncbi:J domain-containing protein [Cytophagaceae bacterium ABcell3]|nr:J domain-containing protein [Cytophagaceae bacterium ABcell3]